MSTPQNAATSSRFRRASVVASTPTQQIEQLLGDGAHLTATFDQLLADAIERADHDAVVDLVAAMEGAADPQRTYVARQHAATALHQLSRRVRGGAPQQWAPPLDAALRLLVSALGAEPHEPELLVLLGGITFELGDDALAMRLLECVLILDPEHPSAASMAETVRSSTGRAVPDVSRTAPSLAHLHGTIGSIIDRASVLADRRISLCMIVKDEEEMLPGCLAAIAPFVDEMIVVDTGSSDRTREIAREHGAQVHEFPWTGSFSDARNESLRHATGDWILWLDADEHLVVEDGPQLRELARQTWVEGWSILETHQLGSTDGTAGSATHTPMRMFKRRPEHRWTGAVHEQVAASLPGWVPRRVRASTVRVDHYGYMTDVAADRDKRDRNLALLLREHDENPSAFTSFNIGTEYAASGDWAQAREWFERSLVQLQQEGSSFGSQQWTSLLVLRAVTARRLSGLGDDAITLADEGLTTWPDYSDLVFEQALAHLDAKRWNDAKERAHAALAMGDAPAAYVAITGKGTFQARHVLAAALRGLGDAAAAREQLEQTVRQAPEYAPALSDLVDVLASIEEDDVELDVALDAVLGVERSNAVNANLLVAMRLIEAERTKLARTRYERVLHAAPTNAQALLSLAELSLADKDVESARSLAQQVDPLDRLAVPAAQLSFLTAAALGRTELLDDPLQVITRSEDLPAAERAVYMAWRQALDPEGGVHALVPQDAAAQQAVLRNLELLARAEATDAFERLYPLLETVFADEYERRLSLAQLYLRLRFPDLAGEELMLLAQHYGPDAAILTGLGKVATIKQMWEDAEVFLTESLQMDPRQRDAQHLLDAIRTRQGA